MVDIEPLRYKESTNINEHNQMVNKINEMAGVLSDLNVDTIHTEIADIKTEVGDLTGKVSQVEISVNENTDHLTTVDSTLDNHARNIKANTDAINVLEPNVDALNKELPTEFTLYRTGSGKIQLQCEKEDSTVLDSNILDMIIPESYNIVSGTTNRSFKLSITFSDGNTVETNDFVIPNGGGTDVTVTGVSLIKVTDNTFKTRINLSDGTPIDSGTLTTVNSVAGAFANNKLTITVNGVSSIPIEIDATGTVYSQGTGIKIVDGTISIDDTVVALKTDITDMETKTNANATFVTKSSLIPLQNSIKTAFNDVDFNSDTGDITFTAIGGQQNSLTLSTDLVWEKMSDNELSNPTIWHIGDQIIGGVWVFALSGSDPAIKQLEQISMICTSVDERHATFEGTAFLHNLSSSTGQMLRSITISTNGITGYDITTIYVSLGTPVASGTPTGSKPGYKSVMARVEGTKSISTVTSCADVISKSKIGSTFILPSTIYTATTVDDTPMHVNVTSGAPLAGSTLYLNTVNMSVIAKTDTSITLNGYGRYAFKTTSGSNSESTIQQMIINSDGTISLLVAGTWNANTTVGNITKINAFIL